MDDLFKTIHGQAVALTKAESESASLREEIADLKSQLAALGHDLEVEHGRATLAEEKRGAAIKSVNNLIKTSNGLVAERDALKKRVGELEDAAQKLVSDIDEDAEDGGEGTYDISYLNKLRTILAGREEKS